MTVIWCHRCTGSNGFVHPIQLIIGQDGWQCTAFAASCDFSYRIPIHDLQFRRLVLYPIHQDINCNNDFENNKFSINVLVYLDLLDQPTEKGDFFSMLKHVCQLAWLRLCFDEFWSWPPGFKGCLEHSYIRPFGFEEDPNACFFMFTETNVTRFIVDILWFYIISKV